MAIEVAPWEMDLRLGPFRLKRWRALTTQPGHNQAMVKRDEFGEVIVKKVTYNRFTISYKVGDQWEEGETLRDTDISTSPFCGRLRYVYRPPFSSIWNRVEDILYMVGDFFSGGDSSPNRHNHYPYR